MATTYILDTILDKINNLLPDSLKDKIIVSDKIKFIDELKDLTDFENIKSVKLLDKEKEISKDAMALALGSWIFAIAWWLIVPITIMFYQYMKGEDKVTFLVNYGEGNNKMILTHKDSEVYVKLVEKIKIIE